MASYLGGASPVKGLRETQKAFSAMPEVMKENLVDEAIEPTVREVVRIARGKVQSSPSIRTRALLNAIGWTINRKKGIGKAGIQNVSTTVSSGSMGMTGKSTVRVKGIVVAGKGGSALHRLGARLIKPSRYAHLVEFGSRFMDAEPFMLPAVESQEQPYLDRAVRAGKKTEKDLAAIGGGSRFL